MNKPITEMSVEELREAAFVVGPHADKYIREFMRRNELLKKAGERSLNWLSSYPGEGALVCWEQMNAALKANRGEV